VTKGRRSSKPRSARRKSSRPTLAKRGQRPRDEPTRTVRIRALDPRSKCGAGTSVEHLFRVDEMIDGAARTHLVFFDRHGWYCEHGRSCPAVDDVRRANRNLDWTRKVG
jgi:hypothetical protein